MYNKPQFIELQQRYENDKKLNDHLNIKSIISLITLLEKKEIQDEEISNKLTEVYQILETYDHSDKEKRRAYRKAFDSLKSYASKEHSLQPKGSVSMMWFTICLAIGIIFKAVGVAIGICVGLIVGAAMEQRAVKQDKIY